MNASYVTPSREGRSPRVRRNPRRDGQITRRYGSISARAEEPVLQMQCSFVFWVDLRACGGTPADMAALPNAEGRSPRVRRNLEARRAAGLVRGSISARAEEPAWQRPTGEGSRVDLRACGGTCTRSAAASFISGRSPRVRRNRRWPR